MNRVHVVPAGRPLVGRLRLPGDKSIAHRTLMLGALADGVSTLRGMPGGADVRSTANALGRLGVRVDVDRRSMRIHGTGGALGVGCAVDVDCGNSGTTMRLLAGLLAARPCRVVLDGDASLRSRPMERIARPLRAMGARIDTTDGHAPILVQGGKLTPVDWTLEVASAQVKSAILLAALRTPGTTIVREGVRTRDHTERLLEYMGAPVRRDGDAVALSGGAHLRPLDYALPGDPSTAAFWLVAASVVPGSEIVLVDVGTNPTRLGVVDVLERMGASIERVVHDANGPEPRADLFVRAAPLRGTTIEADEVPRTVDEIPVLAVAAACAEGDTVVHGAGELRHKESDRLAALGQLTRLGVDVVIEADGMRIRGQGARGLTGGAVDAHGDHRIAMAFAVAALRSRDGIDIGGAEAVGISYPEFFETLVRLGAGVST